MHRNLSLAERFFIFIFGLLMSRLIKAAIIGAVITTIVATIVCIAADVSFKAFIPFYMPWAVLVLIRLTSKRK
jgi:hypothetical protein